MNTLIRIRPTENIVEISLPHKISTGFEAQRIAFIFKFNNTTRWK